MSPGLIMILGKISSMKVYKRQKGDREEGEEKNKKKQEK
jgi:hypothetical protein